VGRMLPAIKVSARPQYYADRSTEATVQRPTSDRCGDTSTHSTGGFAKQLLTPLFESIFDALVRALIATAVLLIALMIFLGYINSVIFALQTENGKFSLQHL